MKLMRFGVYLSHLVTFMVLPELLSLMRSVPRALAMDKPGNGPPNNQTPGDQPILRGTAGPPAAEADPDQQDQQSEQSDEPQSPEGINPEVNLEGYVADQVEGLISESMIISDDGDNEGQGVEAQSGESQKDEGSAEGKDDKEAGTSEGQEGDPIHPQDQDPPVFEGIQPEQHADPSAPVQDTEPTTEQSQGAALEGTAGAGVERGSASRSVREESDKKQPPEEEPVKSQQPLVVRPKEKLKSAIKKVKVVESLGRRSHSSTESGKASDEEGKLASAASSLSLVEVSETSRGEAEGPPKEGKGDQSEGSSSHRHERRRRHREPKSKRRVHMFERNNITDGPEDLIDVIFGSGARMMKDPGILLNIWPGNPGAIERCANVLDMELVDQTGLVGNYYKFKVPGPNQDGITFLVSKRAADEVLQARQQLVQAISQTLGHMAAAAPTGSTSTGRHPQQTPTVPIPQPSAGLSGALHPLSEQPGTNPFIKHYKIKGLGLASDSSLSSSEKTPTDSTASSLKLSYSSGGGGILVGEFSEEEEEEDQSSDVHQDKK